MKKLRKQLQHLPIKWKLTMWSTFLIFLLFASYNVMQYVIINHWTVGYEKIQTERYIKQVDAYITNPQTDFSSQDSIRMTTFLNSINEKHQLIRILDENGYVMASVSREIPNNLVKPKSASTKNYLTVNHWEDKFLVARVPVKSATFTGTIEVIRSMEIFDEFIDTIFLIMFAAGVGGLILSFMGGNIIAKQLLSKIQVVTDTMHRIRQNGMTERVPVPKNRDELAELGILFNEVMDDMERAFAQQKQFVEDASHELRTPLAIIQGHLSMLNRWGKNDPEVLEKSLQSSLKEVERLNTLVTELLELSRAEAEHFTTQAGDPSYVNEVIDRVSNNFRVLHPNISLQQQLCPKDVQIDIPANYLEQILIILLDNAIKYSRTERPAVTVETLKETETVSIHLRDEGIGIPAEDLPFVLNRFYRVDKARTRKQGGNGLGLAIAKRLVLKYNGSISLKSTEGEGTTVSLTFPVYKND